MATTKQSQVNGEVMIEDGGTVIEYNGMEACSEILQDVMDGSGERTRKRNP
jgi:hypothetical protein